MTERLTRLAKRLVLRSTGGSSVAQMEVGSVDGQTQQDDCQATRHDDPLKNQVFIKSSSRRLGANGLEKRGLRSLRRWHGGSTEESGNYVLSDGGDRARDNADHAGQRHGFDGQGRHQDDDVAERSEEKTSLSGLLRHSMTHSCFEWIGALASHGLVRVRCRP